MAEQHKNTLHLKLRQRQRGGVLLASFWECSNEERYKYSQREWLQKSGAVAPPDVTKYDGHPYDLVMTPWSLRPLNVSSPRERLQNVDGVLRSIGWAACTNRVLFRSLEVRQPDWSQLMIVPALQANPESIHELVFKATRESCHMPIEDDTPRDWMAYG